MLLRAVVMAVAMALIGITHRTLKSTETLQNREEVEYHLQQENGMAHYRVTP